MRLGITILTCWFIGLCLIMSTIFNFYQRKIKYSQTVKGQCIDILVRHKGEKEYNSPVWKYSVNNKEYVKCEKNKSAFGNPSINSKGTLCYEAGNPQNFVYLKRFRLKELIGLSCGSILTLSAISSYIFIMYFAN